MSTAQTQTKPTGAAKRRARKRRVITKRKAEAAAEKKEVMTRHRYVPYEERTREHAADVFRRFPTAVLNLICSFLVLNANERWGNYRVDQAYDNRNRSFHKRNVQVTEDRARYLMYGYCAPPKQTKEFYKGPFFITMMLMPLRGLMCTCRFFLGIGEAYLAQADLTRYFKPRWVIPGQKYMEASCGHGLARRIADLDHRIRKCNHTIRLVQKGRHDGDLDTLNRDLATIQADRVSTATHLAKINAQLMSKVYEIEKNATIFRNRMAKKQRKAKAREYMITQAKAVAVDTIFKLVDYEAKSFLQRHCGKFLPGANSRNNYDPWDDDAPRRRKNRPGQKEINRSHEKRRNKQVYLFAVIDPRKPIHAGTDLTWADLLFKKRPAPMRNQWREIMHGKSEMMTFRETLRIKVAETVFGEKRFLVTFYLRHVQMPNGQLGFQLEV